MHIARLSFKSSTLFVVRTNSIETCPSFRQVYTFVDMAVGQEPQSLPIWKHSQAQAQEQIWFPEAEHNARPDSPTLPRTQCTIPVQTSTSPPATYEEATSLLVAPVRFSTPAPQIFQSQPQSTLPIKRSTSPPARRREGDLRTSSCAQYSSPQPQPISAHLGCVVSEVQQSIVSIPPMGRLKGCQMGKHGNIKDEEGGPLANCTRVISWIISAKE